MKPTNRFSNQLLRNIEQGRNRFVVEGADGNVSLGFAEAENHDIDMQAALSREVRVRGRCPGGGGLMTPGEVEAYERMHMLAVERMGEDVILRDLVRLYEGVLRDGAPIREFEECAILYAVEVHDRTPDERGRMMRWRCMVVMRDLLGVRLQ